MKSGNIRVGIIGLGFIGKVHAQAYHSVPFSYAEPNVDVKVAAILRTSTGRDEELITSLGNPLVTTDSETFYAQNLDVVDICTPNFLHLEQARTAATHGCHIYMEKPLGWNLEHAQKIANAAKEAAILSHTAFTKRYYPAVQEAKAILEAGLIGEILNFNVHYYHNSYMDPKRPISWRLKHAPSGGGAMADLGVHIIDMTRYLLGEAAWASCHTRTFIKERPKTGGSSTMEKVDVDDWGVCTIGMRSGAIGIIEATRFSGGIGDSNRMEIFGSRGSIVIDLKAPLHCIYYDQNKKSRHVGELDPSLMKNSKRHFWPAAKMSMGSFLDAHTACIYDLLQCVKQNQVSMTNFTDAVKTQEILEAAYLSAAKDSQKISFPIGDN